MPPSRTPAAPPAPATAPQTPSALLRSAPSLKVVVTIESAAGEMIAAPRPCAARAAISWPSVEEKPAASEATATSSSPRHEDFAPAEQVGRAAAEQEEAAEGEDVGVDDPGQVLLGEVERVADRRQGDVDDRGVEDDDELGRGQQDQGPPAFVLVLGGTRSSAVSQANGATSASGLDQAAADRVADQLDPVAHAELAHRVGAVVLDRLLGEVEELGDLLASCAPRRPA